MYVRTSLHNDVCYITVYYFELHSPFRKKDKL